MEFSKSLVDASFLKNEYGTERSFSSDEEEQQSMDDHLSDSALKIDAQENHCLRPLADFLVSCTALPQLVMWGFLSWYLLVVILNWHSLHSKPFLDACVIMMLVGLVLNVNAFVSFQHHIITCPITKEEPTLAMYIQRQPASIIRLFMIPYCVSCYSGIANSTPNFFSIFPMQPSILIPAIVGAITFPALLRLMADIASHIVYPKETDLNRDCRRSEGVAATAKF